MKTVPETVRQMQAEAWANKLAKGFNTSDVPLEFELLHGELAEAFNAWRRNQVSQLGEELADVAIYLFGLAEMNGIDLQDAIARKLAVNSGRRYQLDPASGTLVKEPDPGAALLAAFNERVGQLMVRFHYTRLAAERLALLEEPFRTATQQPTLGAASAGSEVAR